MKLIEKKGRGFNDLSHLAYLAYHLSFSKKNQIFLDSTKINTKKYIRYIPPSNDIEFRPLHNKRGM